MAAGTLINCQKIVQLSDAITTMKVLCRFNFILLAVFAAVCVHAQTEPPCPKLELVGPAGILNPDEKVEFQVTAKDGFNIENAKVKWTVSAGKIIAGNGTPKAMFAATKSDAGSNITVSAQVTDSNGCSSFLSDVFGIAPRLPNETLDEFGKVSSNDIWARLDNLFNYLTVEAPKYEGILVITFDGAASRSYRISRIKLILGHIKFRRFDATRLSFYFRPDGNDERTVVWTTPSGFDYSDIEIDSSKLIKAEEVSSKLKDLFH